MNLAKTEKTFRKMMKELKKEGFYDGRMNTTATLWYPDKMKKDGRFLILPNLYRLVEKYWPNDLTPYVIECLYTMDVWCFKNKFDNLLGMMVVDLAIDTMEGGYIGTHADRQLRKKMNILAAALEYQNKNSSTEIAFLMTEMKLNYKKIFDMAMKMHNPDCGDALLYFEQAVEPCVCAIAKNGARAELFSDIEFGPTSEYGEDEIQAVVKRLNVSSQLDEEVVSFIVADVLDYVLASDCNCYNPYWLFGSRNYKTLTKEIWKITKTTY